MDNLNNMEVIKPLLADIKKHIKSQNDDDIDLNKKLAQRKNFKKMIQ
jgi:hypothetical protein